MGDQPDDLDSALDEIIEHHKTDEAQEEYIVAEEPDTDSGRPKGGKSPLHILVERLGGEDQNFRTTKQVADIVNVSESTIRRIAKRDNAPGPSHYTQMGDLRVALYNDEDIERLRDHLKDQHRLIKAEDV